MNYLQQIHDGMKNSSPDDRYFRALLSGVQVVFSTSETFTSKEVNDSRMLLLHLLHLQRLPEECDAKHFHVIAIFYAAWTCSEEIVTKILEKTPYPKCGMRHAAALLFAYQKKWTSFDVIRTFYEKPLTHTQLSQLAFAAGAGGNLDLIQDLHHHFPWTINKAHRGAEVYSTKETTDECKKMGLPLHKYLKLNKTDSWKFTTTTLLTLITFLLFVLVLRT